MESMDDFYEIDWGPEGPYVPSTAADIQAAKDWLTSPHSAGEWRDWTVNNFDSYVPTHGNWAGPGWSGGQRVTDSSKIDWSVPAIDQTDAAAKDHDRAYADAEGQIDEATRKLAADVELIRRLLNADWNVMSANEKSYAMRLIALFMLKIRYIDIPACLKDQTNIIIKDVNNHFASAATYAPRVDPLAIDLDGDGIETVGVGTAVFDYDGDGVKTGTGWVKGDDGLLVLDRNQNGTIDTGSELFGVDTVLANGEKAANGFAALRDLDSNADGKFDSADFMYNAVKVWQDKNQDGVSQAEELKTIAEHGVVSIDLNAQAINCIPPDGNRQTAISGNVYNLELVNNPFYREFVSPVPLTEQAKVLTGVQ